ncbi:Ku protein [Streptomyces adustus]|uniref:Ku protein n=1 Tax=Streptomyces adustus TaxID=1609272 RepID=UPI0035DB6643
MAIAKFAWSGRERLGMLRVRGNAIVLHQLLWPGEVRDASIVDPPTGAVLRTRSAARSPSSTP